ncbi:unnamed protein product, partial [Brenthis ino]
MRDKNMISCLGSSDSRDVSPSIISELPENIFTNPWPLTPDIQESSGQITNTYTAHENTAIQNALADQHSILCMETVSLIENTHSTYHLQRSRSCTPDILEISTGHTNLIDQDAETEQRLASVYMIHSTPPLNMPNKEDSLDYNANETILQHSTAPSLPYFSPREIRPLPIPHVPIGSRKRKIQKSEVLTSTPVKEEQKAKFVKANSKVMKNINKDLKTKTALQKITKKTKTTKINKNTKGIRTTKNTKFKKSKDKENDKNYTMLLLWRSLH